MVAIPGPLLGSSIRYQPTTASTAAGGGSSAKFSPLPRLALTFGFGPRGRRAASTRAASSLTGGSQLDMRPILVDGMCKIVGRDAPFPRDGSSFGVGSTHVRRQADDARLPTRRRRWARLAASPWPAVPAYPLLGLRRYQYDARQQDG
jgi:hypothetical protein